MSELQQDELKTKKVAPPSAAANYLLLSAGSIFTSMLIAGFLVGYAFDQIFDTTPIFMLLCALLGFIGGIQKVHKLSSRLDNVQPADKEKQDSEKAG
ncbi:MAG: AtpZ/AtpI family protein [Thiomicrorhabdus sp.]|nr:AtpZ/AtpI family protein [Thiomicrorhabdus sp.]